MARKKSYVREEAVARARDAFREHGFQTLGIRAIEDIVGIGRFAIRTEFDGKDGLFLEALKLYGKDIRRSTIRPMEAGENLDVLEELLAASIDPKTSECGKFGCLFLNTTVENAALQNPKFRKYTEAFFDDLLRAATGLVERAKANGSAREEVDANAAGEFIKGVMMAAALMNRDAKDVTASTGYIKMALATVGSWRKTSSPS